MWDRDVLTANDIIAETSIDLYRWFLKVRDFFFSLYSLYNLPFAVYMIRRGAAPPLYHISVLLTAVSRWILPVPGALRIESASTYLHVLVQQSVHLFLYIVASEPAILYYYFLTNTSAVSSTNGVANTHFVCDVHTRYGFVRKCINVSGGIHINTNRVRT